VPDPCDASVPVAHGELGDCTQVLPTGMTCQPACHAGYEASGASYCYAGRLTPASCEVALAGLCGRETEMQLAKEELKHQDECSRSMAGAATVSRPFPSWNRSILTEIYLCHAWSCQKY
jgi:hypothetical protein